MIYLSQVHERFKAVRHDGVHPGKGVRGRRGRVGVEDDVQGGLRVARGPVQTEPESGGLARRRRSLGGDRDRQLEQGLRAAVQAVGVDEGGVFRAVDQR